MVVIPRPRYKFTLDFLQVAATEWTDFKNPFPLEMALSDLLQQKVVGVLGSHDISGFARDGLAFLASAYAKGYSVQVREWPGQMVSVSLSKGSTKYTVIIGVPSRKLTKYRNIREEKQTAYTCQIWGRGIE